MQSAANRARNIYYCNKRRVDGVRNCTAKGDGLYLESKYVDLDSAIVISNQLFAAFAGAGAPNAYGTSPPDLTGTCSSLLHGRSVQNTINSREQASHSPLTHTVSLYLNPALYPFNMPAAPKQRKIAIVGSRSVGRGLTFPVFYRCLLSV